MKRSISFIIVFSFLLFCCQCTAPFPGGKWKVADVVLPEPVGLIKNPTQIVVSIIKQTTLQLNENHSAIVLIKFGPLISEEPRKDVEWSYNEDTKVLTLKNAFQNWQVQEFTVVKNGNDIYFNPGYIPIKLKMERD